MPKQEPIVKYDPVNETYGNAEDPRLVWFAGCDKRYVVEVRRDQPYQGTLFVFDTKKEKTFTPQSVSIGYDAVVGPDIADIATWKELGIKVIDGIIK